MTRLALALLLLPGCAWFWGTPEEGEPGTDWLDGCNTDSLPTCGAEDPEACALFDRINCERSLHDHTEFECDHGLAWSPDAAAAAGELAEELVAAGSLEHDGWGRQNLAINTDSDRAMDGLMTGADEPHCEDPDTLSHHCNNMHCAPTELGVAVGRGPYAGQPGYFYYVMNFR